MRGYEEVRFNSADGTESWPIRSQPESFYPGFFPSGNSLPGSGRTCFRTRFFLCVRPATRFVH